MDVRELGRQTARRWTRWIAAAGIALTGLVGVGTYQALAAARTGSAVSGTTSTTTSNDHSGLASSTSSSDDSGTASASSGLSAGTGASQTGSSGS